MSRTEARVCTGEDHGYCCTDDYIEQPDGTAVHRDDIALVPGGTEDPPFCRRCGHACAHWPRHRLKESPGGPVCEDEEICHRRTHRGRQDVAWRCPV